MSIYNLEKGQNRYRKMELNIAQTNSFNFENRENLKNAAKNILSKQGASDEAAKKFVEETIFSDIEYCLPQNEVLAAALQFNISDSLKETLRYLKSQNYKKQTKKNVLGELWETFENTESYAVGIDHYTEEFIIDETAVNIFAA